MARGAGIVVSSDPHGIFLEGTIDDTSLPGTIMQIEAATTFTDGEPHFIAAAPGTDGKRILCAVLLEPLNGFPVTQAYVSGSRGRLYVPISGEDMNVLVGEGAGTSNSYAIGDRLMIDAENGILVPESGSPQDTLFVVMEAVASVAGSYLLWCKKL